MDTSESDFKPTIREDSKEVFNEYELPVVLSYLESNLDLKNLGILLMFLTGVRVGELVTLKHSDFSGTVFKVQRTETRIPSPDGHGYEYKVKDFPKAEAGVRNAIIPEEYARRKQNEADIKRGKRKIPADQRYNSGLPKSGVVGVTYHRQSGKWQATYKGKYIGLYDTVERAGKAVQEEKEKLT